MTSDGPTSNRNEGVGASLTVPGLITTVADVAGCSPFELPPLNEIVDPDALDRLFDAPNRTEGRLDRSKTAVVALDIDGYLVVVRNDGSVSVTDRSTTDDVERALATVEDAIVHGTTYDWTDDRSLSAAVVEMVADATASDPIVVRDAIDGVLDRDALDGLFRPRINRVDRGDGGLRLPFREYDIVITSDGTVTLQPTLTRIKRTGGNLLVVGSVPRGVSDETSRALLGSDPDRVRLVALDGRRVETAFDRLESVDARPSRTVVIDHGNDDRSAAAASPVDRSLPVRAIDGGIDEIAAAITGEIDSLEEANGKLSPGQLRFCLDSLGSLHSRHEGDETEAFLETVCDRVKRAAGIGHFVLLAKRDSRTVRAIEGPFDVVVELRVGVDGAEQRWHLRETGHVTEWFQVENPLAG